MSKIRIRMGEIEVEYEGSEAFLKEELLDLLRAVSTLYTETEGSTVTKKKGEEKKTKEQPTTVGTTTNIAAKLSCKTGPDLALAAATRLTLGLGQETFPRQDLLKEMQSASSYYKRSFGDNLSSTITRLLKTNKLVEPASGRFALSAQAKEEMRKKLAT